MADVTSKDIKLALTKKHENREFFLIECKNGPSITGMLQFDGIAIYKSWAHPRIVGYEIKISRSDFLKDSKYARYLPYCHEFYFVTPAGMVQRQEIEDSIGLMWYNPKNKALTTKKKAVHRKIEVSANMLLYVIMTRLESDRTPFHSDKAEYWRDWLDNKIETKALGGLVKSKLLEENLRLERENHRNRFLRNDIERHDQLLEVMKKHGISMWGGIPEALDKALSRSYLQYKAKETGE